MHNAIDQIRGEAASLQFFSDGAYANPMVVRIAGYAYQKGFGGHFHNDNSIGALLEIPGLVIASPSRADDAVGMLRTCAAVARHHGKVCLFLEPIALLHDQGPAREGRRRVVVPYPAPGEATPLGEGRVRRCRRRRAADRELGQRAYMSLQAAAKLRARGIAVRVLDLRWLAPLPWAQLEEHALATGRVLVVDECRATGAGPSALILAELAQNPRLRGVELRRVAARDTYIPLGPAADRVLVQVDDIVAAVTKP